MDWCALPLAMTAMLLLPCLGQQLILSILSTSPLSSFSSPIASVVFILISSCFFRLCIFLHFLAAAMADAGSAGTPLGALSPSKRSLSLCSLALEEIRKM